ncbi:MAG: hypothetical protein ACLSG5_04345 [Oscillospiraceae bacterium]
MDNLQFDDSECDYAYRGELRRFAEETALRRCLKSSARSTRDGGGAAREQRVPVIRALRSTNDGSYHRAGEA